MTICWLTDVYGRWIGDRLPGELWGWLLFYGGIASVAFGSAYYHLRPDDNRVLLDTLPVSLATLLLYILFTCSSSFRFLMVVSIIQMLFLTQLFAAVETMNFNYFFGSILRILRFIAEYQIVEISLAVFLLCFYIERIKNCRWVSILFHPQSKPLWNFTTLFLSNAP